MRKTFTPGDVMNQIRTVVRQDKVNFLENEPSINELQDSTPVGEQMQKLNQQLKRLSQRVTPNMPVAFVEPQLVSRFKLLGKVLVPIRKFGTRLFTKWYVDVFSHQQKYLNQEIWFGLNAAVEALNIQTRVISHLKEKNASLQNELFKQDELLHALRDELLKVKKQIEDEKRMDFDYSTFANKFSAEPDEVKRIYSKYMPYFQNSEVVVDLGCGKGYFLELLQEHGIRGYGVDSNPRLIEECVSKGFQAEVNDVLNFLSEAKDSCLDGIFVGHVIEHLSVKHKIEFIQLLYRKLKKDGTLVIETPNTTSTYVMHNVYYLDPTHEKPLFPEALKHLFEITGFTVVASFLSEEIVPKINEANHFYNFSLVLKK
ncbi:class I SAM-dependent methyltransferase [Cohnella massiliensis]|uniref:class I SAM-dependent methyltransferase n=1 Tax=Cohnella massiliensis TaxID=1816691 RepID=UPI0009BB4B5F|nr:class I SAM-dependent methyltransferase [Cohnella massiliensis]